LNSTLPLPLTQALADALKALYVRKTLYENAHAIQFRKNIAAYTVSTAAAKDLVDLAVRAEATARERLPGWFALA
jgi:hypothetical protein